MSILEMYIQAFGEYPILIKTVSYEDEIYQELMERAIVENKPITPEQLDKAFENYVYDVANQRFTNFGKKGE